MKYRLDRSVRWVGDTALLGGSPARLLRLTEAGAELVRRLSSGAELRSTRGVDALVDRLVDAGIAHPEPDGGGPVSAGDVTVVVPVRDRPESLARLLESIERAGAVGSLVVVDDGSQNPVHLDTRGSGAATSDRRVLRRPEPGGPAAARNAGAAHAVGAVIAFVDSDCTVESGWLDPLLAHFADPRVAAVAPRVAAAPGAGVLAAYDSERSPLDLGAQPARVERGTRVSYVPAAALVVRAEAFADVGGFDEGLRVGEDVDLVWRLVAAGHRVRYDPRAVVRHEVRRGARAWLAQRYGYGTSAAALDLRHPRAVAPAVVSRWSAAVWGLVLAGHPGVAGGLAAGTVGAMARRLGDVPAREVARMVLGGHLGAGRQLARATVRAWWPVALAASVLSRRARRVVGAAVLVTAADAVRSRDGSGSLGDPAFAALALVDDVAYGAGVWAGALRHRATGALRPVVPE